MGFVPRTRRRRRRSLVVPAVFVLVLGVSLDALVPAAAAAAPDGSDGASVADVAEAQRILDSLGYPAGPVDGIDGPQTRRGLCAWRRLEGHDAHRGPLTRAELVELRATTQLPEASEGRGVTVDRTCQTVSYQQDGQWQRVMRASTGSGGLPRPGDYTIRWRRAGWHTSTLYPSPTPNMYNSMYFSGVIAIHGSHDVPARPVSAGCVRVTPSGADYLFSRLENGDPVRVIGEYSRTATR